MTEDTKHRWRAEKLLPGGDEPDPRFTLANERTFLAWIRTSLAFLAGGGVGCVEPVGVTIEVQDRGAGEEPVEHRCGDGRVAEDLAPAPAGRFVVVTMLALR